VIITDIYSKKSGKATPAGGNAMKPFMRPEGRLKRKHEPPEGEAKRKNQDLSW